MIFSIFLLILTCENCFVRLKLPAAYRERDIAKFLVLEELSEIVGQPAFRHLELYRVTLPGNIDTIRDYADLWTQTQRGHPLEINARWPSLM